MGTQQLLFTEPAARETFGERPVPAGDWVLDEETRAIGLRGAAEARAILRARRTNAGRAA